MSTIKQRGQGLSEYVIVLAVGVIVLTVPWNGQVSPIVQLAEALQGFYTHYSYTLSLP
ncbi:MAG: hypothetical protein ACYDEV_05455 [Acidiferrobacter sp.]